MKFRIWRHPQVEEDLLDIWLFIAKDSIAAADRLIDAIEERCLLLADYPEIGPARPEIGPDIRALSVRDHLVLYRRTEGRVEIVRVVHGARRLDSILE